MGDLQSIDSRHHDVEEQQARSKRLARDQTIPAVPSHVHCHGSVEGHRRSSNEVCGGWIVVDRQDRELGADPECYCELLELVPVWRAGLPPSPLPGIDRGEGHPEAASETLLGVTGGVPDASDEFG